jgi:TonB family protein
MATFTPAGPCGGHANADPAVAATPDVADITPQARASRVNGTAAIHVSLDAQGRVVDAVVAQSSGNAGLDVTAVQMARNATYTPRYVDCKAVAGEYTFTVRFFAW